MSHRLAAVLIALAAVCAACGSGSSSSSLGGPPVTKGPSDASLVKAAKLTPCPSSSSQPVSHGLPDVTLPCVGAGPAVHLAGLTGTPSVVNVWASWCTECRPEMPYLLTLSSRLAGKVRVLGVDTADTDGGALSFAAAHAMHYPSVSDPTNKVIDGLHISPGPPETAFVNAAGVVVHVHPGGYSSLGQLQHDVATYLHVSA
ncbi:MAG TPA: TlpA disulfide reductase family protein [Mycobacteriales bacterium]|nr:TlpA disulfide reductase family protein [Mycobacteriales bacterium]